MQKKITCLVLLLIAMVVQLPQLTNAEKVSKDNNIVTVPEEYIDLKAMKDESGMVVRLTGEDRVLEGLVDEAEFYYEVPAIDVEKENFLHLDVAYSELLLAGSSLTVYIDGSPVYTAELPEKETEKRFNIPLTKQALEGGYHHVSIAFYGQIAENLCANEENPANWASILASSYFQFTGGNTLVEDDALRYYPYPFIQSERDDAVQSMIVIPDDASEVILNSAMQLAAYLTNETMNKQEINIIREADVEKITTHLIAVGTPEQWNGVIGDLFTSAAIDIPASNIVIHNTLLQFPKAQKQLLFVTGENENIILEKISMLTDTAFIEQLNGNSIHVEKLPERTQVEQKSKHAFKEMSIPNLTLDGIKTMSQNYFYAVPNYLDTSSAATLHLKMKVSETLFQRDDQIAQKEAAELVVYINEVPHSIAIDDLDRDSFTGFYEVEVPIEAGVLDASPYVMFEFKGNGLKNREICVPPTDDRWIYVDEESYIHVPMKEKSSASTFASWPAPFVSSTGQNETTILLPDNLDDTTVKGLQMVMSSLGTYSTLAGIEVIKDQDVTEKHLHDRHVILLGDISQFNSLKGKEEQLLLQKDSHHRLDVTPFAFVPETSAYTSFIQPSIWQEERTMAVFSAIDVEKSNSSVSKTLLEFLATNGNKATVVVENENGAIFTNTKDFEMETNDESPGETISEMKIQTWVFVVFIGIVVIGFVFFISMYRKQKKSERK